MMVSDKKNLINDNDNENDTNNESIDNLVIIDQHTEIDAQTMAELLTTSAENARQISDSNKQKDGLKEINGKCLLEVYSTDMMTTGPPPAYSLTSPCLPPSSLEEQDWPSESPSYFDAYPPYPAGPPLLKIAYPKDIPGPTYACPKCEETFLYYRPAGIVYCPFCHSAISIGRYVRIRAWSFIIFGVLFLIISLIFGLTTKKFTDCSTGCIIAFALIGASGLLLLLRAFHMCFRYPETERIEFP